MIFFVKKNVNILGDISKIIKNSKQNSKIVKIGILQV